MTSRWEKLIHRWSVAAVGIAALVFLLAGFIALRQMPVAHAQAYSQLLTEGQSLSTNQWLRSPNGQYYLIMQSDGNLVVYNAWNNWSVNWASNTYGPGNYATLQYDGNFDLFHANGSWAGWSLGMVGYTNAVLYMQDDGNLVEYNNGVAIWASNWHRFFGNVATATRSYNGFPYGQCTWYAAELFHEFWLRHLYPNLWNADAWTWPAKMRALGFQVSSQPMTEAVVVWPASANHVAWVDYVEPRSDGVHLWVREMNHTGWGQTDSRDVVVVSGMQFIPAPAI